MMSNKLNVFVFENSGLLKLSCAVGMIFGRCHPTCDDGNLPSRTRIVAEMPKLIKNVHTSSIIRTAQYPNRVVRNFFFCLFKLNYNIE